MTELNQLYKCQKCENIVQIVHPDSGTLACCDEPMLLIPENTVEASKEKHIPVIEVFEDEVLVKVGSIEHPMEPNHHIEWIELLHNNEVYKKFLNPGDKPEACFKMHSAKGPFTAREYCNVHGLWSSTIK